MVLQQPAIARRAIAIELLRRFDQVQSHRRRAQSTPASPPRSRVAQPPTACPQSKRTQSHSPTRGPIAASTQVNGQLPEQKASVVSTGNLLAVSNDPNGFHSRRLELDAKNKSAPYLGPLNILSVTSSEVTTDPQRPKVQAGSDRDAAETPVDPGTQTTPPTSPLRKARHTYERRDEAHEITPRPNVKQQMKAERRSTIGCLLTPPLSEAESFGFDATSTEVANLKSGNLNRSVQDDATEGAQEYACDTPRHISIKTDEAFDGSVSHRAQKRWSAYSMESVSTIIRKSPVILRSPSKTNGGLLEFKANTAGPKEPVPKRNHRHMLSLNIPIRPSLSQPEGEAPTSMQPPTLIAYAPRFGDEEMEEGAKFDAELQYKQRHIFVGTASLHAFLDVLETCSHDSTTKSAVLNAFTTLAHEEQLLARRCSLSSEDWSLVSRITTDVSEFDYITLVRVQLGSISLQQFVDSIPFDAYEEAPLTAVVEAFKIASHMDAMESQNTSSKARAFRDLLLSQSSAVD